MMWHMDPEIRAKVERFDAKPWCNPFGERPWLVELDLSEPRSRIARHEDGSKRQFATADEAWAWIEANREARDDH